MMADPETMAYNAGWDVAYAGYHRDTGCIDCPDKALADWYDSWVGNEPERFYAYIKRSLDGAWIGDVNFHYTPEKDWWDMGIVMYAPFRGKGYAVPAPTLMLDATRSVIAAFPESITTSRSPGTKSLHGRPIAGQAFGS